MDKEGPSYPIPSRLASVGTAWLLPISKKAVEYLNSIYVVSFFIFLFFIFLNFNLSKISKENLNIKNELWKNKYHYIYIYKR